MSEAKHTPGPWRVAGKGTIRKGDNEWIASIHWRNREPNARLIAAAPELLWALIDAEYALTNISETFSYDEGDSVEKPCPYDELCGEWVCNECGCIRKKRDACRAAIAKAVQP